MAKHAELHTVERGCVEPILSCYPVFCVLVSRYFIIRGLGL